MKRFLTTFALLTALLHPARADAVVEDVLVRRTGDNVNIRVTVSNPAATKQAGPVVVDLYVRPTEADAWTKVQSWNNIEALAAGNRVSRDYFDENNAILKDLASRGRFQARAVVTAPGQKDAAEKTSWYDTTGGDY
jgi:hypothetical protein